MRLLIDLAIALLVATVIGFTSAWFAVEHGPLFGAVEVGEWTAWPASGSPDADPYTLAVLARTGEVPLGAGEGLAFSADMDSEGEPLSGACRYAVIGQTPASRLWTLTAYDSEGRLMVNAARRSGFHSGEIIRAPDGSFTVAVSADVQPGNWLPVDRNARFQLVLRLYDTPLTTGGRLTDLVMPEIRRVRC